MWILFLGIPIRFPSKTPGGVFTTGFKKPSSKALQMVSKRLRVVSRSALGKQKVYYPRVSAEAEDVRYTIRGFGVLIKNDFEV